MEHTIFALKHKEQTIPCEDCNYSQNGKPCHQWINCVRYMKKKRSEEKEYDFWQWYRDYFRADCSGAPDIIANG